MRILINFAFLFFFVTCANCLIKCPLFWEEHYAGRQLPETVVSTVTGTAEPAHFLARVWKHAENKYYGGRMEKNQAFVSIGGIGYVEGNYELLTNPNKCQIRWADGAGTDDTFKVAVDEAMSAGELTYLGRTISNFQLLAGEIEDGVIHIVNADNITEESATYQHLQSFSYGLNLEVSSFELLNDESPAKLEVLGVDTIFNQAESEVRQWVSFSKRILEFTTIETMRSWGKLWTFSVKLDFSLNVGIPMGNDNETIGLSVPIGGAGFMAGNENGEFTNSSVTRGTERQINVTREVVVPPRTNVMITSELTLKENFKSDYIATGVYSAPGLSYAQIEEILLEDNIIGTRDPAKEAIIVEVQGTISGTLALNNKFNIEVL